MNKKYFLVIDTETANDITQPLPYDIGYAICDRQGNIYKTKSFIVAEIFLAHKDLMQSCYFKEKVPKYWEDIKQGKRIIKSLWNIRKELHQDMKEYNIAEVGAYNMGFDKRALNNDTRYCTNSFIRWFFPYGTEFFCIWNMACQVLLNRTSYIKFALENNLISDKGNILTNAECCYQYLMNDVNFKEEHTGLEDVLIEVYIMKKCFDTHKKLDRKIYSACWRIPQRKAKELELRKVFGAR